MRKALFLNILLTVFLLSFVASIFARSGCCSHHGGVCGCGCCDGTSLSSTCAPYYPQCSGGGSVQEQIYIAPTSTPYIPPPTFTPVPPTNTPTPTITPTLTPTIQPTTNNVLSAETKNPTPTTSTQSQTNGNPVEGFIGFLIVGGLGYWIFKNNKNNGKKLIK